MATIVKYKPSKSRLCLFDGYPCHRPPSPLDGDFQCGEVFFSSDDKEEIIRPRCPRCPGSGFVQAEK